MVRLTSVFSLYLIHTQNVFGADMHILHFNFIQLCVLTRRTMALICYCAFVYLYAYTGVSISSATDDVEGIFDKYAALMDSVVQYLHSL
jgi:hypothetical protein